MGPPAGFSFVSCNCKATSVPCNWWEIRCLRQRRALSRPSAAAAAPLLLPPPGLNLPGLGSSQRCEAGGIEAGGIEAGRASWAQHEPGDRARGEIRSGRLGLALIGTR